MISKICSCKEWESAFLSDDYYGKKIRANFLAYGLDYDFCTFYKMENPLGKGTLSVCNQSAVFTGMGQIDYSEIADFISLLGCTSVEYPPGIGRMIMPGFVESERTLFAFYLPKEFSWDEALEENPSLDEVYKIASEGFPELKSTYPEWLADTSHRIRHGVSKAFLLEHKATAFRYWQIDGVSFYGQIAVSPKDRGQGLARRMLYLLAKMEQAEGNSAWLFARENRKSFYKEIGFLPMRRDIILENQNRG